MSSRAVAQAKQIAEHADREALTLAQRRGAADAVDRQLRDELVEDALASGPLPVGSDVAALLSDEEREAALFEPTPAA